MLGEKERERTSQCAFNRNAFTMTTIQEHEICSLLGKNVAGKEWQKRNENTKTKSDKKYNIFQAASADYGSVPADEAHAELCSGIPIV